MDPTSTTYGAAGGASSGTSASAAGDGTWPMPGGGFLAEASVYDGRIIEPSVFVEGLISAPGTALLSGPTGTGKSTLLLGLALDFIHGMAYFAGRRMHVPAGPRRVLWLCGEDPSGPKLRRQAFELHRHLPTPRGALFIAHPPVMPLAQPAGAPPEGHAAADSSSYRARLEAWLTANRPQLLIFDTLSACFASGASFNDGHEAQAVTNYATSLATRFNALVVLVCHPPKANPADVAGSQVFQNSTDQVLTLRRPNPSRPEALILAPTKIRAMAARPLALRLLPVALGPRPAGQITEACVVEAGAAPSTRELLFEMLHEESIFEISVLAAGSRLVEMGAAGNIDTICRAINRCFGDGGQLTIGPRRFGIVKRNKANHIVAFANEQAVDAATAAELQGIFGNPNNQAFADRRAP